MTAEEKVCQLNRIIKNTLLPLIDRDYYLLEVPYYTNIGDTLIWQGELDMLSQSPYKCKGMYSLETFHGAQNTIEDDSLVLFQGGGNFGDLWTKHHDFKMNIMKQYPNCVFLFFPQTVWFQKKENLYKCAEFMAQFDRVTICARDTSSYKILKTYFRNRILLLPDMAFCINTDKWKKKETKNGPLLLKRKDKELIINNSLNKIERIPGITITDWPTMQKRRDLMTKIMLKLRDSYLRHLRLADPFVRYLYRPYLLNLGTKLLNSHTHVYTTRLHAAILAVLLGKDITFLDNSYGKNRTFFESWLDDYDNIKFITND